MATLHDKVNPNRDSVFVLKAPPPPPLTRRQLEAMRLVDEGMALVPIHPIEQVFDHDDQGRPFSTVICAGALRHADGRPRQHDCAGPGKCPSIRWRQQYDREGKPLPRPFATDERGVRRLFSGNDHGWVWTDSEDRGRFHAVEAERGFKIHCGASRLVVLDADERHGGIASIRRVFRDFDLACTWMDDRRSSDGRCLSPHLYFQEPPQWAGLDLPAGIRLFGYEGVELLRGEHLCVVGGSDHESGIRREWVNHPREYPLAFLPEMFLDFVVRTCANRDTRRRSTVSLAVGAEGEVPEGMSDGRLIADGYIDTIPDRCRNSSLFAAARSLLSRGRDPGGVVNQIRTMNEIRCVPPLPGREVDGLLRSAMNSDPPGLGRREIDALLSGAFAVEPCSSDIPLLPPGTPSPAGSDGADSGVQDKKKTRAVKPPRQDGERCYLRMPQKYHPKSGCVKHDVAPCDNKYHLPCWMYRKRCYQERTLAMAKKADAAGEPLFVTRSTVKDTAAIRKQRQRLRREGLSAEHLKVRLHTDEVRYFGNSRLVGAVEVSFEDFVKELTALMERLVQLPAKQRELTLSKGWDFPREEVLPDPDHRHLKPSRLTHEERIGTYEHFGIDPVWLSEDGGKVDVSGLPQDQLEPLLEALQADAALPTTCECHICRKWREGNESWTYGGCDIFKKRARGRGPAPPTGPPDEGVF